MTDVSVLLKRLRTFRDERDWKQFHNHKDLALSLVLESTEVLEHFQWKNGKEVDEYVAKHREAIAEELADVLKYLVQLADDLEIEDIVAVALKKLEKDAKKYPVELVKGKYTKYSKLEGSHDR